MIKESPKVCYGASSPIGLVWERGIESEESLTPRLNFFPRFNFFPRDEGRRNILKLGRLRGVTTPLLFFFLPQKA